MKAALENSGRDSPEHGLKKCNFFPSSCVYSSLLKKFYSSKESSSKDRDRVVGGGRSLLFESGRLRGKPSFVVHCFKSGVLLLRKQLAVLCQHLSRQLGSEQQTRDREVCLFSLALLLPLQAIRHSRAINKAKKSNKT